MTIPFSSSAVVTIKLRNRGIDAYMAEEYGSSISIERRISHDGSGSYKIRSQDGSILKLFATTVVMQLLYYLRPFNFCIS